MATPRPRGVPSPETRRGSNSISAPSARTPATLTAGASLVVRDYDGNPAVSPPTGPLPIVVDEHLAMDATGTLRLVFDADPWDSLISFAPGIPVALGGMLELTFAPDVDVATQSGRTIDLFDWTHRAVDTCIIDQNVDSAEALQSGLKQLFNALYI